MIAVSEKTHHQLAQLGNLEDSFDTVISRLIENVATSGRTLAGSSQIAATAPLTTTTKGAESSNG